MYRRFFYGLISVLPVVIVFAIWIEINLLSGSAKDDFFIAAIFAVVVGYAIYFNAPTFRMSIEAFKKRKPRQKEKVDRDFGTKDSAAGLYGVLDASKFVSDHKAYRLITPVYTVVFVLLLLLYFSTEYTGPLKSLLEVSITVSFLIAYISIPRYIILRYFDYQFYLAKGYLTLSQSQSHNVLRLRLFIDGIEAYNLFLQKNFKIKMKELQEFYSRLSSNPLDVRLGAMNNLYNIFQQDGKDSDKLEPFRQIRNTMESVYQKPLEIGLSKRRNLQDWLPLMGLIISTVIAIIQVLISMMQ